MGTVPSASFSQGRLKVGSKTTFVGLSTGYQQAVALPWCPSPARSASAGYVR
jgi:hypothetical protein